jgi:peroxiredoxin
VTGGAKRAAPDKAPGKTPGRTEDQAADARERRGPLRYLPYLAAALICSLLALRWFLAMGPATHNEVATFCLPLAPDPGNKTLGTLPAPAPPITATDYQGIARTLSAYRGQVVVLHFFATWCAPCEKEMPGVLALADQLKDDDNVSVIAVANDQNWSDVSSFFRGLGRQDVPMTLLLDPNGDAMHAFGTDQLPETYLIDPQGVVRYYFGNARDYSDASAVRCVESLLTR